MHVLVRVDVNKERVDWSARQREGRGTGRA